jgi:hypothetical protein
MAEFRAPERYCPKKLAKRWRRLCEWAQSTWYGSGTVMKPVIVYGAILCALLAPPRERPSCSTQRLYVRQRPCGLRCSRGKSALIKVDVQNSIYPRVCAWVLMTANHFQSAGLLM